MKIRVTYLVIIFITCTHALMASEKIVINENFENKPLSEVLEVLKDNYHLKIAFAQKYVRDISVTATLENMDVHGTFDKILVSTELTFELIEENVIIIKRKRATTYLDEEQFELTGEVSDAITGELLPYAYLRVEPDKQNLTTNVEGYFTLAKASASTTLRVSYLGYQDTLITITEQNQKRRLHIALQPQLIELEEVVISDVETDDFKTEAAAGKITINPIIAKKTPSTGEADIFRTLQLLPGVNATNEVSSGLNINGGTSNQNLILFDGFTVYHVDHFFGYFSAFNPVAIKSLQLYKGGFEAKYGGRVSSVVDITGKDGNRNKTSGSLGLNLLSVNTSLEVPLSENGATLFFSGRRSYTDILSSSLFDDIFSIFENSITEDGGAGIQAPAGITESVIVPDFYYSDLNLKLSTKVGLKNHLSFSFYDSNDILNYLETVNTSFRDTLTVDTDNIGIIEWGNVGTSLKLSRLWNSNHFSNMLFSYSFYQSDYREQSNSIYNSATLGEVITATKQVQKNNIEDISFKLDHEWELTNSGKIETGVAVSLYSSHIRYDVDDTVLVNNNSKKALLAAYYLQGTFAIGSKFSFSPGLRTSYFSSTDQVYFEPRASFNYKLNNKFSVKGATGVYYQFVNQSNTKNVLQGSRDFWVLADNKQVPVQRAVHGLLGIEYQQQQTTVSINYFKKDFQGLLEYAFKNGRLVTEFETLDRVFIAGKGISEGMELMIKRDFGKFNTWASYTLSEVRHQFPGINGSNSYYADHDQRHEFNWFGVYTMGNFEFSATWLYGSGKPYTSFDGVEPQMAQNSGSPINVLLTENKNEERLPDYHRLDVSASYKFKMGVTKADISMSIFNLYNRVNVLDRKIEVVNIPRRGGMQKKLVPTDVELMGITPNISLSIAF